VTTLDWVLGFMACGFALWLGVSLAKKQARAFSGQTSQDGNNHSHPSGLPPVTCVDYGDMRFLHLGSPAVQGSMKISQPFEIHLDYVQRMMGWLLLTNLDQVHRLRAMQLGLGAASLTKFCHTQLGMHTTAVELNPQVIATCRQSFHLPDNSATLQVLVGDAADAARDPQWHGKIDVLQVDLYDQDAARPVIDTEDFYNDCCQLLTAHGCMTVNLFGRASRYEESLKKIRAAFGPQAVWAFKPTAAGNSIVMACRTPRVFDKEALQTQAQAIEARWNLPATQWLKVLAPTQP
jgi:spermidine synthase